jgi:hypothetical protein
MAELIGIYSEIVRFRYLRKLPTGRSDVGSVVGCTVSSNVIEFWRRRWKGGLSMRLFGAALVACGIVLSSAADAGQSTITRKDGSKTVIMTTNTSMGQRSLSTTERVALFQRGSQDFRGATATCH